jgi:hypothetical protein
MSEYIGKQDIKVRELEGEIEDRATIHTWFEAALLIKAQLIEAHSRISDLQDHLSEALAGRDQWRATQLKLTKAEAEIEQERRKAVQLQIWYDQMKLSAQLLQSKLAKATAALEFYRDERNWLKKPGDACSAIIADTGKLARETLAEIGAGE